MEHSFIEKYTGGRIFRITLPTADVSKLFATFPGTIKTLRVRGPGISAGTHRFNFYLNGVAQYVPASAFDVGPAGESEKTGLSIAIVEGDVMSWDLISSTTGSVEPPVFFEIIIDDGIATILASALDTDVTLAANSDLKIATQKATKAYADALIEAANAIQFKGVVDCSANPNYPAANAGHQYIISVAGKIGGGSGPNVQAFDTMVCIVDSTAAGDHATVGANWAIFQANIDGAVTGPASAVSGNLASFNGTTGKIVQDSGKAIPAGDIVGTSDSQTLSLKKELYGVHASDDTWFGLAIPGYNNTGGVTQWDAVYLNGSSQWVLADANGTGTTPALGLAVSTETTGNPVTVMTRGSVRNDAWAWTPGGLIYVSTTAGGLTQTQPATVGDEVQAVGYALTADIAIFNFEVFNFTVS